MPQLDLLFCDRIATQGRVIAQCGHLGRIVWDGDGMLPMPEHPSETY